PAASRLAKYCELQGALWGSPKAATAEKVKLSPSSALWSSRAGKLRPWTKTLMSPPFLSSGETISYARQLGSFAEGPTRKLALGQVSGSADVAGKVLKVWSLELTTPIPFVAITR